MRIASYDRSYTSLIFKNLLYVHKSAQFPHISQHTVVYSYFVEKSLSFCFLYGIKKTKQ